jgi:DNA polymerase-3 subunit beta
MQFTIKTNEVKALLLCAAKKDIRAYLNGIYFESNTRGLTAVSTDGHRLLAIQFEFNERQGLSAILPREALERAIKTKATSLIITIEGNRFTIDDGAQSIGGLLLEGLFPNWRRVIPSEVNGEATSFNNDYLADFDKAARLICGGNCKVQHNGASNSAMIRFAADNVLGVVMPLRDSFTYDNKPPSWVQSEKTEALEVAA